MQPKSRLWTGDFGIILAISLLSYIGCQGLNNGTPIYVGILGGTNAFAGMLILEFSLAAAIARIAIGRTIDRRTRRGFMIAGAVLLLIGIWNLALRRIAEKRGQELAGETIARATSDLKVYERTRLAVELHDSLAQTLTGIALELATAEVTDDSDPKMIKQHLGIAARALRSCRMELRNSLWDLRHETLENDDMEATILKTIQPHRGKADVSVRFSVPRDRISDNTAHAILRIIRELTVNAIRHGQATAIRIAGAVEGDRLKFSVKDNGCGFDPDNCPNDEQGHYGLLGIRERINTFEGQLKIESAPGQGTKATIEIKMPREQ